MSIRLNVYDNIFSPKVQNFTTATEWFNLVKDSNFKEEINAARQFSKGHNIYEFVKRSVPAVTYNFTYHDSKKDCNCTSATGLLYIDVDNNHEIVSTLDKSKIYSLYKSFGGKGYSIVVKVNGLTLVNYTSTYNNICAQLGLTKYFDPGARKATQANVLSYDPEIFINESSYTFDSILDLNPTPSIVIKKEKKAYTVDRGVDISDKERIRFDNIDDFQIDGEMLIDWNGLDIINCWLPIYKKNSNRNNTLLAYTNNLIWLNPHLSKQTARKIVGNANQIMFTNPVDADHLTRIINSVFEYKINGSLAPILNWNKRKIIFKKSSTLSKDEKLKICRDELAKKRTEDSLHKMYAILENWQFSTYGKITQSTVYKNFNISKKTVEKYWLHFKDFVKELNNGYHQS
ncbi:BT4734/BF3469 family protein [Mucilaginibacter aquatilis]|uniref:Virulence-protein E N-terminal domain-containing protein n=1 Tax=Mucilaginibacter aquatilis TaxID=1517760 RepID=A0A6I4I9Z8_9SPHI|nr:BT4734/BF3469 family protein [Mucilaginibacter aquatilis]MVN92030.1 hypothetical protein [Mucilaginibacter aquatilis]